VRLGVNLLLTPDNVGTIRRSLDALLDLGIQAVTFLRPKGAWATEHWPSFPDADQLTRLARDLRLFLRTRPHLRLYVDTALRGEWARLGLLQDPEPEVLGCGGVNGMSPSLLRGTFIPVRTSAGRSIVWAIS
jgi:hypothetical protein